MALIRINKVVKQMGLTFKAIYVIRMVIFEMFQHGAWDGVGLLKKKDAGLRITWESRTKLPKLRG